MLKQIMEVRKIKKANEYLVKELRKVEDEISLWNTFKETRPYDAKVVNKYESLIGIKRELREKLTANRKQLDSRYTIERGA